jgi:hypothetical protein
VPEKELEDPFVDELVTKLTPGANYMVTQAVGTYPGKSPERVQSGGRRGGGRAAVQKRHASADSLRRWRMSRDTRQARIQLECLNGREDGRQWY